MKNISQDANFLLYQIKGHLKEEMNRQFFYVEEIQSIAFGPLLGADNVIPPTSILSGSELQGFRQRMTHALEELVSSGLVLYCGKEGKNKIYRMNGNISG